MSRSDEYVTITAKLKARTDKAVLLDAGDDFAVGGWVPRSCLHFISDKAVAEARIDDELEIRVREWVAEERGFL